MGDYGTMYSGGSAITSSCLDGVPFKLGPKFLPPTKIMLPPELELTKPARSTLINEEYSFEVEEAVLMWSAERERQLEEQQRQAAERATRRRSQDTDSSDSGTELPEAQQIYQNISNDPNYENPGILKPQPAPRANVPKVKNSVGNPTYATMIANFSNNILQPTPISSNNSSGQAINRSESREKRDFDVTLFEKVDDPFDNMELKSINDMAELASVLKESSKTSTVIESVNNNGTSDASSHEDVENNIDSNGAVDPGEKEEDTPLYENIESKRTNDNEQEGTEGPVFNIRQLPPVPPRRDLVGRSALPPIGRKSVDSALDQTGQVQPVQTSDVSSSVTCDNFSSSFPQYENTRSISAKAPVPVPKPPRTFKYSRHDLDEGEVDIHASNGEAHVQFRNVQSNSNVNASGEEVTSGNELNFISNHFDVNSQKNEETKARPVPAPRRVPSPPSRPSSQQSWNRYSPLPITGHSPRQPDISLTPDPYDRLSNEARSSVDSLLTMGFSKDRTIRAVEKLGDDQKEVVEYLCLVDQLTEKGFDTNLAENALLLFQNSMLEASKYLEYFKQFEELGFHGDRIKEALVSTKNDREKSLDILTASS